MNMPTLIEISTLNVLVDIKDLIAIFMLAYGLQRMFDKWTRKP